MEEKYLQFNDKISKEHAEIEGLKANLGLLKRENDNNTFIPLTSTEPIHSIFNTIPLISSWRRKKSIWTIG